MNFLTSHREILVNLVFAGLVLAGSWVGSRLLSRAVDRSLAARRLSSLDPGAHTRFRMIVRLARAALLFLGLGLALYLIDVSALRRISVLMFASAGVAGIALGFAAQTTTANLVSGIIIAFVQPLRLGDKVEIGDDYGEVEEIGLFYTFIKTWDNRRVVLPNQLLSNHVIRNYTLRDPRMVAAVNVRVDHGADVEMLRRLLLELAESHELALKDPEPKVEVTDLDDRGLTVRLVAWAADQSDAWALAVAIREAAARRLGEEGLPLATSRVRVQAPGAPAASQQ